MAPMANPELVQYCADHLHDFSAQELRESLLQEGIDSSEIDAALKEAAGSAETEIALSLASALSWMLLFLVLLGGFSLFVWTKASREHAAERVAKAKELEESEKQQDKQAEKISAGPATTPAGELLLGYFGYSLRLPQPWISTEGLSDVTAQEEQLLLHRPDMPQKKIENLEAFLQAGGILLQVSPRGGDAKKGLRDLATLRSLYAEHPAKARPSYRVEDSARLPFPAFRLRYSNGRLETFLQGARVFYKFSALKPDKGYDAIISSLAEPAARDRMRGFVLVGDDPRSGRSYWHDATGTVVVVPPEYSRIAPFTGKGLRYDFSYRHDFDPFEVRLRFDPTAEQTEQYLRIQKNPCWREGKCPAMDPDAPSDVWVSAIAMTITAAPFSFDPIPRRLALEDFGADWGMLSPGFELGASRPFNIPYRVAALLSIHKNAVGHYHIFYLAANAEVLKRHTNIPSVGLGIRFPSIVRAPK